MKAARETLTWEAVDLEPVEAAGSEVMPRHPALEKLLAELAKPATADALEDLQPYYFGVAVRATKRPGSPVVGSSVCLVLDNAAIFDIGWADENVWHSPGIDACTIFAVLCARLLLVWGPGPRIYLPGWCSSREAEANMRARFMRSIDMETWGEMRAPLRRVLAAVTGYGKAIEMRRRSTVRTGDGKVIEMRPRSTVRTLNRGFEQWCCGQTFDVLRGERMSCKDAAGRNINAEMNREPLLKSLMADNARVRREVFTELRLRYAGSPHMRQLAARRFVAR